MTRLRRLRASGEAGASLVLALLVITVIAVVMGALLTRSTTNVKASVALRGLASNTYDGDGAAQVAINTLRRGMWNNASGTSCFGGSNTLLLSNFYPALNTASGASAFVSCAAEAGTGAQGSQVPISDANKPGQAILTLSTSGAETGQTYGQSNKAISIHGAVTSDSTINSASASLNVTGGVPVRAVGTCTGSISPACTTIAPPGVGDPNVAAPTTPPAPPSSLPACTNQNKVADFLPGVYTTADTFNNCKASWLYLHPGTYFFDFTTGSHVWDVGTTVVGGTLTSAESNSAPTVPGACVNPINSTSAVGVQLVFGGDSQLLFDKNSAAEFCATYSSTSIPTATYGLKANLVNGATTVHAESGCVILVNGCDVISDGGNGTKPSFYFQGFVYVPRGSINIAVNNTTQPFFNFGIISRILGLSTTGSSSCSPPCAFISLPDNSPGFGTKDTIVDLTVYVCPGSSACSTSGRLQLRARVDIDDPTGTPVANQRVITILSWSQQN